MYNLRKINPNIELFVFATLLLILFSFFHDSYLNTKVHVAAVGLPNCNILSVSLPRQLKDNTPASPESADLKIIYKARFDIPYGINATLNKQDFKYIVMHWTASGHCNTEKLIQDSQNYDTRRGGFIGYHFYIAPSGQIYQAAPMSKRTNHIKSSKAIGDVKSSNSIGISFVCGERGYTQAQLKSALKLVSMLQKQYSIPTNHILAHPEVQTDKNKMEGLLAARFLRANSQPGDVSIFYVSEDNQGVLCSPDKRYDNSTAGLWQRIRDKWESIKITPTSAPPPEENNSDTYADPQNNHNLYKLQQIPPSKIQEKATSSKVQKEKSILNNKTEGQDVFYGSWGYGSKGAQVERINTFLYQLGYLESIPEERNLYTYETKKAVMKFQQDYAKEILYPAGLSKPTGYWGPQTRKWANKMLNQNYNYQTSI